ncbi:MAG: 3-isopropylmalate dehydratase large subunit [Thermaerobacter sp.]|nr:3-isopropylmalate dehydratase large subunit [Thermaerobacter sp.]
MAMTLAEKMLADRSSLARVHHGEIVETPVDLVMGNDITAPIAIREFEAAGATRVFDAERVALVMSHFVPAKDINSADQTQIMRRFAREQAIKHYYPEGTGGIEHTLLPERGIVVPGDIVIGADSHTCTYGGLGAFATGVGSTDLAYAMATGRTWFKVPESMRFTYYGKRRAYVTGKDLILHTIRLIGDDGALYRAMEFTGEVISDLPMEDRLTMSNMTIEAGGKVGICATDDLTLRYEEGRAQRPWRVYQADPGATYVEEYEIDVSQLEPQVAFPSLPSLTRGISDVGDVTIDQVFIGSCTNGRLSDLRTAAAILRGKKVHPETRLIVIPATQDVYKAALREGLIEVFVEAGASVSTSTCGPCLGGHMGVLGKGERCLSTSNRNYVGRMGDREAEVFLAGPAVAAATAVRGRITDPREFSPHEEAV